MEPITVITLLLVIALGVVVVRLRNQVGLMDDALFALYDEFYSEEYEVCEECQKMMEGK
jgi:hypothetical protein